MATNKQQVITASDIERDLKINTIRGPLKRRCSQCGQGYFRRNLAEVWTTRNLGRRYGWHKEIAKVCIKCQDENESKRILTICDVQFSKLVKKA